MNELNVGCREGSDFRYVSFVRSTPELSHTVDKLNMLARSLDKKLAAWSGDPVEFEYREIAELQTVVDRIKSQYDYLDRVQRKVKIEKDKS